MNEKINSKMLALDFLMSEVESVYHTAAGLLGISDSMMGVLYGICCRGDSCGLSDIYKLSGIPKQTVNSAIRKMEADGLLYLENTDGRSKRAVLTEKGRELAQRTVARLFSIENRVMSSWSERDIELMIELNERFARDMRRELSNL